MQITPDDFPVIAIVNLIYSRINSTPLLTAASDQMARIMALILNEGSESRVSLMQDGYWTGPERRGPMSATAL